MKKWNYERLERLEQHRKIAAEVKKSVDAIMKSSLEHIEIYRCFFQQRALQEERYAQESIFDTNNALNNTQIAT